MESSESFQTEFDRFFSQYKGIPIAIYGTGKNAELLVKYARGYNFFALVSPDLSGQKIYGKDVITIEEAVKMVKVLIIAAIPSSTGIIYARIKDRIPSNILVYDMRGQRLNGENFYTKNPYWEKCAGELYQMVDLYDIVSFDIFDTLVMRKVLRPTDIFHVIEKKLEKKQVNIPFCKWRINSEKEAGKHCCPTFVQIYENMRRLYGLSQEKIEELKRLEIDTELEYICCRHTLKELLLYTCRKGKTIYLTTDMYFPKDILKKILDSCGIICDYEMLISCEYNASKENMRLYDVLKKKGSGRKILHIGDHHEADVLNAEKQGVDSFWIMSGYDMIAASSMAYLVDAALNLSDRVMLGTFIADLFNDPFALNENRGKINLNSYHSLAYALVPVTALFLKFIIELSHQYDCILFPSRDGYFLNKLFQSLKRLLNLQNCAEGIYFYASRSVVNRAMMVDEYDIVTVCGKLMSDSGLNIKEFFKMQFKIDANDELDITVGQAKEWLGEDGLWKRILSYKKEIIEQSNKERQNYLSYLRKTGADKYHKIAVVDIVAQGTLVYGLSKIMNLPLDLIALGTSAVPNRYIKDLNRVKSIYGNVSNKVNDIPYSFSDFSELHLFLEMLYASCEGQFAGFREDGTLVMNPNEYNCDLLTGVQEEMIGIMIKLPDYMELDITPWFALSFLRMLYGKNSNMPDDIKRIFSFSDPYSANKTQYNLMEGIG